VRSEWSPEELVESWTLLGDDLKRVGNKSGATRLGFAVLLKYFELEARFPRAAADVPPRAVAYVAEQVDVPAAHFSSYWSAVRAVTRHRAEIRGIFGFREATRADEETLTGWLAEEVCPVELGVNELADAVLVRCRALQIEPLGRIERIVGSARARHEQRFCARTVERLGPQGAARLEALVDETAAALPGQGLLAQLKADPGRVGLETLLREVDKLAAVRALELPQELFADCSEKLVDGWRARAARLYPSDLRASPTPIRLTLLAALCWRRQTEIADGLVDLLIGLVHKVNATAEQRVEKTLTDDLKRVRGKQGILFRMAAAAVEQPDETVRRALFPVVGEGTLRDLVREAEANELAFRARVRTVLRSSYSGHYRRMLGPLLGALRFRSNNAAYRPVIDALALLARYARVDGKRRFYGPETHVPLDGVVPTAWRDAVVDEQGRIDRIPYELCVLVALRDAIRRREIYIEGAYRWRDPENDLPGDFEASRDVHYAALRQPLDPREFINSLRSRMTAALDQLDGALQDGDAGGVRVVTIRAEPWIAVPRLEALPEPVLLDALKSEVARRWGTLDLLNVLKESEFLTDFTREFQSVASREVIDRETLRRRLLLCLFALGTNIGVRGIVATGEHGENEAALRHVRRHYINRDNLRRAITRVADATFAARDLEWWGDGTACASDSTQFGAWESNLMTEFHARYGGPGGDDLLARRARQRLHLQPAQDVLLVGGRGDDRGAAAALHDRRDRDQLHRHARRVDHRVRVLRAARLPAAPAPEADRRDSPLPPRRHAGPLAGTRAGADAADPVGADRAAIRPDGQVRHRAATRDRRGRAGPEALHPRRPQAPHLPGAGGTRARRAHDLRLRVPRPA
jgi:hypothetical protein